MRKSDRTRWLSWRVAPAGAAADPAVRFQRTAPSTESVSMETLRAEAPGPDGIRHGLVARVRAEIAAGTYDTDEKWRIAEDRLCGTVVHSR
ncbi:MAG TPA: hypothetical protein VGJ05_21090 [Fimbriiglobus sp.]